MADLAAYARSRGLNLVGDLIAARRFPAEAAADAGLCNPIATEPTAAMQQMVRRGLESRLAQPILGWLATRPVELGLLSWDVLSGSLLGPGEDALLQTLRDNARRVRAVLPEAGAQYTRGDIGALVTSLTAERWAKASEDDVLAGVTVRDLGALDELRRRGMVAPLADKILPAFRAYARALHFAHLPTLASAYLTYLFRVLDDRGALPDLCEVLLDVGGVDALPEQDEILGGTTVADIELLGYVGIRAAIATEHTREYLKQLEASPDKIDYTHADPDKVSRQMPRAQVAHAELMLKENGPPVPYEILQKIIAAAGPWRYGLRVLATAAAAKFGRSDEPLGIVDTFVAGFGNDFKLWYLVNLNAPAETTWMDKFVARLIRELTYLPHEIGAWSGFAMMLDVENPAPALSEVNRRAEWQCGL
jgi:hypothetical protein